MQNFKFLACNFWCEIDHFGLFQGRRSLDGGESTEKIEMPSLGLYHEELEGEDYIFRTNIDEING